MKLDFIDTHAHLYDLELKEQESWEMIVGRSKEQGVKRVYMPNLSVETLPRMMAMEQHFPDFCKSMMGLHPCEVDDDFEEKLATLSAMLGKHPFIAVGEMGLDLYHSTTHKQEQMIAFEVQAGWARQHDLPLVIHCREAFDTLFTCLEKVQDGTLRGVVHCFTGTLAQAKRCIAFGFHLGIGGIVTYKKAGLAEVVRDLPLEHLVLETDTPYLAPVPKRGKQNEPSFLPHIATEVARLKGLSIEKVSAATTKNATRLFERNETGSL
ncbi:MAG: TatD family hydrolase [Bacteroidota bacterium]